MKKYSIFFTAPIHKDEEIYNIITLYEYLITSTFVKYDPLSDWNHPIGSPWH
jgi:hypothetical protein